MERTESNSNKFKCSSFNNSRLLCTMKNDDNFVHRDNSDNKNEENRRDNSDNKNGASNNSNKFKCSSFNIVNSDNQKGENSNLDKFKCSSLNEYNSDNEYGENSNLDKFKCSSFNIYNSDIKNGESNKSEKFKCSSFDIDSHHSKNEENINSDRVKCSSYQKGEKGSISRSSVASLQIKEMSEYWLISAPGDKTCQQTWETMNNLTNKQQNLSTNYKFHIPDLKVGTLDQLVGLSDDLGKLDGFVEQVTRKVAQYLGEVLEDQRDKLQENLMANNSGRGRPPEDEGGGGAYPEDSPEQRLFDSESSSGLYVTPLQSPATSTSSTPLLDRTPEHENVDMFLPVLGPADLPSYLTRFQWDIAKYPIKQSLRNIADIISKQVGQIDADLKTKSSAYNNLKGSLQNLEKKQTGSLLTRNLADLVKKEHFILESDYLQTLLVIVPKTQFAEWHTAYEKITDMIVPRSTLLITQDNEYGLFTVTLFKKVVEEFKLHAREKKFVVRDFIYNEEELAAGKNEITKLVTDKKKQFGPLVRWLKVNFSECFCAWIHVKALRVFVESVLRYGLPVNFQAILIHPNKKTAKRLRDVLNQLYGHLDSSAALSGPNLDAVDIPGLGFGQSEYFPYVYYKINVDMIESKI